MERKVGFEHVVTKQMSIAKYLLKECPSEYTIVSSKYIPLNQVEVTYSNIVPVIVGMNPNHFGLPYIRKTTKKMGTYYGMICVAKNSKNKPVIPSWAEFTGHVTPLNEWNDGYEYMNKEDIIITEKFSLDKEEYEVQNIESKPLQRKRIK